MWGSLILILLCTPASGQTGSAVPTLVEVYWNSSRTVVVPGISHVVVLDEDIARAETEDDTVRLYGLARGETVVVGFRNGNPTSIRVRVVERPQLSLPPSLRIRPEMAQGTYSSIAQIYNANGTTTAGFLNGISWSQMVGAKGHLDFASQMEENGLADGHGFNVRSAILTYRRPGLEVDALDFTVDLTSNAPQSYLSPFSFSDSTQLRGVNVGVQHGNDRYNFFAGTTIPYFFLTVGSSRDVIGFSFDHRVDQHLSLFGTTSFLNAPLDFGGLGTARSHSIMQTSGFTYVFDEKWAVRATGGVSNHGTLARGEFTYSGHKLNAYGAAATSSPMFPLNQLQSLFAGTESFRGGLVYKQNSNLSETLSYQHTSTREVSGITTSGHSDYLTPGVWYKVNPKHDLNFNYTFSQNSGGFSSQSSTGNRFDTTWHYQIRPQISNSTQVTFGSLQDPLQLSSEDQFMFRDSMSFPVKSGNLLLSFEHDRTNPSLVQKLNSELYLLSPALQALFLQDPVSFVNSSALPPEIRDLLRGQQPLNTAISASGQFAIGSKFSATPNFSFARTLNGNTQAWTPYFGYGLRYQCNPTLQFTSGLTNVWVLANTQRTGQRTTLFSFGFVKSFSAVPVLPVIGHRGRIIEGRVFRDKNVSGTFNVFEPGLDHVQVRLENGDSVETDEEGRYKFTGVEPGDHQVSISLTQFRNPVRMTTRGQVDLNLIRERVAVVNFGVVDFARVMGNVFNDLRFEGQRKPDSRGVPNIHLFLDDGKQQRKILVGGTGEYEVDDVAPGDYQVTVDMSSVPPNYVVPTDSFQIHVTPVSTSVQDIPVRALRSIAGRVLLKVPAQEASAAKLAETSKTVSKVATPSADGSKQGNDSASQYTLVPMADVQISAGYGTVKTDEAGNFLLRDLPAGDLNVVLIPLKDLPSTLKVPTGVVHMPPDPIQIQGATIVISNPELLPYLVERTVEQIRAAASKPPLTAQLSH